jgi:cysteine desulfurase
LKATFVIYLDNNASTQLDPEVRAAITAAMDLYGNPSSVHSDGRRARRAIEEARDDVARLVGARPEEIFFTSGGTEANALAIFGGSGATGRVVTSAVEHPSVREPISRLAGEPGAEALAIDPDPSGALDPERILEAAPVGTRLVSVMAANNEFGAVFPVSDVARTLRVRNVPVHSDAIQAAGRIPVDAPGWEVDLLSISAHKLHGPKGVGALYVRRGFPLRAHTPGGGQEKKIRGGTENTAGIVGFGVAARLALERLPEAGRIAELRDRLESGILATIPETRVAGGAAPRLPNTTTILFGGLSGEALLIRLDLEGVAVSVGSACSSGTLAPSPAILALGYSREEARGAVRFSLSRWNTPEEIDRVLGLLPHAVAAAREARSAPTHSSGAGLSRR